MRIIVVLVAVLILFSGCEHYDGIATTIFEVTLLAESPQEVEVSDYHSGKRRFLLNLTYYADHEITLYGGGNNKDQSISEITKIKNRGEGPIYAVVVSAFYGDGELAAAFAELQQQFPSVLGPITSMEGSRIIDFPITLYNSGAPEAEEMMRFVEAFRNDICGGNADACRYMRVVEPGENVPVLSDVFINNYFYGSN